VSQLLDGWVAPGPASFTWHALRDSHDAATLTAHRALDMLEGFDAALAGSWRQLLAQPLEASEYPLDVAAFTADDADAETPLTDDNKFDAVRAGCRRKLLLERRPAFDALAAGFSSGEFAGVRRRVRRPALGHWLAAQTVLPPPLARPLHQH
jgi:hypothetical protein